MNAKAKQAESLLMADTLNGSPHGETVVLYSVLSRICDAIEAQTVVLDQLSDNVGEGLVTLGVNQGNMSDVISRLADEVSALDLHLSRVVDVIAIVGGEVANHESVGVVSALEAIQRNTLLISRWPQAQAVED
jgi:hypothetical protein